MRLVPEDTNGKITFYTSHAGLWAERAEEIGTTPEMVATLAEQIDAATAALAEQRRAQSVAQAATLKAQMALDALTNTGSIIVKQIRAKASESGDGIYVRASIDIPSKGAPIPEPGKPTNFRFSLDNIGQLMLSWTCKNPRGAVGTMYQIRRKIVNDTPGEFEFLAVVGTKKFVDETIPAGTKSAIYEVQAIRSTKTGPVATFNVNFGTTGQRMQRMHIAA